MFSVSLIFVIINIVIVLTLFIVHFVPSLLFVVGKVLLKLFISCLCLL